MSNLLSNPGLGAPAPTFLPDDPEMSARAARESASASEVARLFPAASYAWADLAREAFDAGGPENEVRAYALARTGYHRGLDALRKAGWRGQGPVPYSHVPNQGFLDALALLARAAKAIGEDDEATRCAEFLIACDPSAPSSVEGAGL